MSSELEDSSSNKQFQFTIVDNNVTAFFEVENGQAPEQESIDSNDSFVIDGNQITHTKQTTNGPEVTVYSDPDGNQLYDIISESGKTDDNGSNDDSDRTPGADEHKAFKFTIADGQVTEVFEIKDGVPEPDPIDDDGSETFTVDSDGVVTRTEEESLGTEITRYADSDGDGFYNRISEQFVANVPEDSPFVLEDELSYSPTDGDDLIAVRGEEDCRGGNGADDFVFREAAHLRIGDFSASADDSLTFDTGLGLTSIAQLQGFVTGAHQDGENFVVDFGPDVSITFVGVQADQPGQISWDDVSVLS
jgi:hypothetical protein